MKKIFTVAVIISLIAHLSLLASAFSPPVPFPILAQVVMGGAPVSGQAVTVEITDSESGEVIDSKVTFTDDTDSNKGQLFFDLGDFRGCLGYAQDGKCYVLSSRNYAGDNLKFTFEYQGQKYSKTFPITSLQISTSGKPVAQLIYPEAPKPVEVVKIVPVETEVEVIKEVQVSVPVYVCADGTEAATIDDCPLTKSNAFAILAAAGVGLSLAASMAALIAYHYRKNKKNRAAKMLLTVKHKYGKKKR